MTARGARSARSWWRPAAYGLAAALAAIQFVPVERVNPPVEEILTAPGDIDAILRRACYDCHSNETRWPWYGRVAPASWLVAHDVEEGREYLNLSTWNRYDDAAMGKNLEEICEEIEEGAMPPWYYLPLHPGARLNDEERALIRAWVRSRPEWRARGADAPTHCGD